MPTPTPRESDFTGPGHCLGIGIFKSPPDDSNVQPHLETTTALQNEDKQDGSRQLLCIFSVDEDELGVKS